MKYFVGTIGVRDGLRAYHEFVCIVADSERKAQDWLEHEAAHLWGGDGEKQEPGVWSYEQDAYFACAESVQEIGVVTFEALTKLHKVVGGVHRSALEDEELPEQARTLARRLGTHLAKLGAKVSHSKLLHAVAASLGETDWHVLLHKERAVAPEALSDEPSNGWTANGGTQPFIPGTGFLYGVLVTVDATKTAYVKVRARDAEEAQSLARRFAAEGNAKFEVDEGNYRGLADYYVGDKDMVYRVNDNELAMPADIQESSLRCQRGAYLVELADLGDGDEGLLWADLSVFDPAEDEPDTESCMSACSASATPEETLRFCQRVAEMLNRAASDPSQVDWRSLQHAFIQAVQGDQTDEALAAIEAKLRAAVRT